LLHKIASKIFSLSFSPQSRIPNIAAFPIIPTFIHLQLSESLQRGNTVQPMLPCWVVPTAGSLSIRGSFIFFVNLFCRFISEADSYSFVVGLLFISAINNTDIYCWFNETKIVKI
jgi:hypothetical protein